MKDVKEECSVINLTLANVLFICVHYIFFFSNITRLTKFLKLPLLKCHHYSYAVFTEHFSILKYFTCTRLIVSVNTHLTVQYSILLPRRMLFISFLLPLFSKNSESF